MSTNPNNDDRIPSNLFERMQQTVPCGPHNHRSVKEVMRDLDIGPIERWLLWLAKVDPYVLPLSTYHSRQTLAGLGMMVVFTALLALVSAVTTLLTTLLPPDLPGRWGFVLLLATLYAFGIVIMDREIVGATSKKTMWIRIPFAICISFAVSFPVKLQFFSGRITNEINHMVDEKNAGKLQKIESLEQTSEPERKQRLSEISSQLAQTKRGIDSLQHQVDLEGAKVECGVKCKDLLNRKQEQQTILDRLLADQKPLLVPSVRPEEVTREIERLKREIAHEHEVSYDFLSKLEALHRISNQPDSADYSVISWFLVGFFMMLEMVPLALKWSLGKTEYNYYIEARNNLNNQKIISLNNLFMGYMQQNKDGVLDVPTEITDIIAAHMEDEAGSTRTDPGASLRDIFFRINKSRSATSPSPADGAGIEPEESVPTSAAPKVSVNARATSRSAATEDET